MKSDIMKLVMNFFHGKESLEAYQCHFINLIPKFMKVAHISEFWPISGINMVYKIIPKLIAARLAQVTLELLSLNQSAFMKG